MKHDTAEHTLIRDCIKGKSAAQEELLKKYYGAMMQICRRYTSNADEAKDLLQEGFIKIFQNLEKFNGNSSLQTWMTRIMINSAIDAFHKGKKYQIESLEESFSITDEDGYLDNPLMHLEPEKVLALLQKMPNGYRTVLNLFAIEGYSHKEIANSLGISEGTSKSQLAKARAMLLQMVEPMINKIVHEFE
jgi:RNA polymerase sigma-70 factor (ECF subfamily)